MAAILPLLALPAVLRAQAPGRSGAAVTEISLIVEAFAGGVQYTRRAASGWLLGIEASAGPSLPVTLLDEGSEDIREWATAWPVLGYRTAAGMQLTVSPIGAALVIGNDFGTVYPAGQAGLDFAYGRLRAGSAIRVVRVAGANGTGLYRTLWIPVRAGFVVR